MDKRNFFRHHTQIMDQPDYNKFWSPAFDMMGSLAFLLDNDFNIIRINKAFALFTGKDEKHLIGKKCYAVVHGTDNPPTDCPHQRQLETKTLESGEFYNPKLQKWLSIQVTPIFDENGGIIGSVHIAADITEHRQREEALRESQERYENLISNIGHVVFVLDKRGCLVHMNRAGLNTFGYEDEKNIQGRKLLDLVHKKHWNSVTQSVKDAQEGKSSRCHYVTKGPTHTRRFWDCSLIPMRIATGGIEHIIGIVQDLTDQKKSAKLAEFYKEYAENIVLRLPISLLVVNRDLDINFVNQHFLSRMRVTKDAIIGKALNAVLDKALFGNVALDKKIMQVIRKENELIKGRFILRGKTYDYMIIPLKEPFGKRMNAMLVMEDVTEKINLEEQLLHAERLSAVGKFTAAIAHEINNPLSTVIGNIQYLLSNIYNVNLSDKKEIKNVAEMLKTANTEARRCAGIVTNLLHFSHKGELVKTKLSINDVVRKTMRLLAPQLGASNVQSVIKLADDLPPVMGNADRLQQVFANLILNAQQVMKGGGKLYVKTSADGGFVNISFKDTGPGIPKKYIRKIFEPFHTTKEAGKGTGLGLFIVHSIMEDHRGKIEVQSKRGGGATFILKLPAVKKRD